jgi:hypothetical protein
MSVPMMAITTSNSTSVKPRGWATAGRLAACGPPSPKHTAKRIEVPHREHRLELVPQDADAIDLQKSIDPSAASQAIGVCV